MRRGRSRDPCGTTFGRRFSASIEFRLLPRLPQLLISRLRARGGLEQGVPSMAGVGSCGRWRWLCAGRPGTGVHGRVHRVYQNRHDHLSHDNHAVGGRDERADFAEGTHQEWTNVMSRESWRKAGTLLIMMPTITFEDTSILPA